MKLADILFENWWNAQEQSREKYMPFVEDVDAFDILLQKELVNVGKVLLYRGISLDFDTYRNFNVSESRKPRDTDQDVNEFIDRVRQIDYEKGIPSRKGQVIFATTNKPVAENYGHAYIVFIPKKYKAIYSKKDPTGEYFTDISTNFDYIKSGGLNTITLPKDLQKLYYDIVSDNPKDLSDCNKKAIGLKKIENYLDKNETDDFSKRLSSYLYHTASKYKQIISITKKYFDQLYVAKAPWVKGYYETMIECSHYYLVDEYWFKKHFVFDEKQNKYVRVKK